jgi:hypothetical protein
MSSTRLQGTWASSYRIRQLTRNSAVLVTGLPSTDAADVSASYVCILTKSSCPWVFHPMPYALWILSAKFSQQMIAPLPHPANRRTNLLLFYLRYALKCNFLEQSPVIRYTVIPIIERYVHVESLLLVNPLSYLYLEPIISALTSVGPVAEEQYATSSGASCPSLWSAATLLARRGDNQPNGLPGLAGNETHSQSAGHRPLMAAYGVCKISMPCQDARAVQIV